MFGESKTRFDARPEARVIAAAEAIKEIAAAWREFGTAMANIEDQRAAIETQRAVAMNAFAESFTRSMRHLEGPK